MIKVVATSTKVAPHYWPFRLNHSPTASVQVQKPHTHFALSALLTDVEGCSDDMDAQLRFGVCILGMDQGGADDGQVELLVIV